MVEIIDTLAQFLCRDQVGNCMSTVQQQSSDPLIQLSFLVFFPIVFLILLIYFLTEKFAKEHKGLRLLLSVAVYLFIIFYGWYYLVVSFSRFWFIGFIVLGAVYVIIHKMGVRESGGGSSGAPARQLTSGLFSGLGGYTVERLKKGGGKTPEEQFIDAEFRVIDSILNKIEKPKSGTDEALLLGEFKSSKMGIMKGIEGFVAKYGAAVKPIEDKYWGMLTERENRLKKITSKEYERELREEKKKEKELKKFSKAV